MTDQVHFSHPRAIRIRGARTHNLRSVDADLPTGQLVVVTGISGSGKSSLAFDTIFAEGQRRYLESVSTQTRSLLSQLPRPEVDEISGLPPTVSVDQRSSQVPARSTLALTTEIYDYLRLLYARAGTAHCTSCGNPVTSQSVDQIVNYTLQWPPRSRLMVLSPMVRGRRGAHKDVLERIARNGFIRARIDGLLTDLAEVSPLDAMQEHTIHAVVDRLILKEGIEQRLRESIELACRESDGTCVISRQQDEEWIDCLYSTRFSCPQCELSFPTPEPRTFSFNSAWGACPVCQGLGIRGALDAHEDVISFRREPCPECHGTRLQPFARQVTFQGMTIGDFTRQSVAEALHTLTRWTNAAGFSQPADPSSASFEHATVTPAADAAGGVAAVDVIPVDVTPVNTVISPINTVISSESRLVAARTLPDIQQRLKCLADIGLSYLTLDRPTRTLSGGEFQRARLAACLGSGLHGACFVLDEPTAGLHPRDTARLLLTLQQLRDTGASVIVVEHDALIMRAADWLLDLGPGAGSDGGQLLYSGPPEAARNVDSPTGHYLAGHELNGVNTQHVLDPLQQRLTNQSSIQVNTGTPTVSAKSTLNAQPSASDPAAIRRRIKSQDQTIRPAGQTSKSRQQQLFADVGPNDPDDATACVSIRGAGLHNLQNVSVDIPLQKLVCVTGVSGSGKSSLIMETLLPVALAVCRLSADEPDASRTSRTDGDQARAPTHREALPQAVRQILYDVRCQSIDGLHHITRVVSLDNSPIGRSSRSCIVTITGIWKLIRQLFTSTREARARGYSSGRFSFNSGDGRCGTCRGTGVQNLEMKFLPDVTVTCPICRGQRFNRATLSVHFNGKSVADVLQMRVDEACDVFSELSRVANVLQTLKAVGLGYLQLGQPSSTFSGGEAQRVRLATELTDVRQSPTLYVLDEPTSGLHPADIGRLLLILRQLVAQGHTVVVVEHQLDVMCAADWIIDVGPDCGDAGGHVVAQGTPAMFINSFETFTAAALRDHTQTSR